jgi:hypothetical protein
MIDTDSQRKGINKKRSYLNVYKTDCHDTTGMLLKVALSTTNLTPERLA